MSEDKIIALQLQAERLKAMVMAKEFELKESEGMRKIAATANRYLESELQKKEGQLKIAKEVLEYYGDKENWSCCLKSVLEDGFMETNPDGDGYYQDPRDMAVIKDKVFGKKAQEALKEIELPEGK